MSCSVCADPTQPVAFAGMCQHCADAALTSTTITMRAACGCGTTTGEIRPRNGQDCVYCTGCTRWQYNAPRVETGRRKRTLATRENVTPSTRARILARHKHACLSCGTRPPAATLTLEHLISREKAARYGFLDHLIDSEWNLAPMCEQCNSGHRWLEYIPITLLYRALIINYQAAQR